MKGSSVIEILRRVLPAGPPHAAAYASLRPAGVLCLLYPKNGECCVLLNKRSECVEQHKGEICFPGGRREPQDRTLLDTALRETCEEMGILPSDVEVLGELGRFPTISNYLISAYVGTIPYPYHFAPNDEVAAVVEVPLSALMDTASLRNDTRLVKGRVVSFPSYAYGGHLVFGATARVLQRLVELLKQSPELSSGHGAGVGHGAEKLVAGGSRNLK